ncbi:MAG: LUD domain-containing protein [Bacteroidia bacterium]
MSAREDILARVRARKPQGGSLPVVPHFGRGDVALADAFRQTLASIGGEVLDSDAAGLPALLAATYPDARVVAATHLAVPGTVDLSRVADPHALENVDLAVLPGTLGVAENAAVWVQEADMGHRVLPFIAQHLVLVLPRGALCWNLHEAYERIRIDGAGYGVWISGPSKTADIEQSLVIGAHGARSLRVIWLDV